MLKQWNMVLIILTYALVIFGTFLTRSGVLSSVHAFAQSAIGPLFFAFIGITFIVSISLLMQRWNALKAQNQMTSMLSREALFLLNNLLFLGILVVCFWGVIFPLISELFTGQKVTVGPPFYERANGPLMAGLLLLMAVAPLAAWGRSTYQTLGRAIWKPTVAAAVVLVAVIISGVTNIYAMIGIFLASLVIAVTIHQYWRGIMARRKRDGSNFLAAFTKLMQRDPRRYGGYLVHISMAMLAIGIVGIEMFQTETQGTLSQGESLELGRYTMVYDELAVFNTNDARNVARAVVSVYKDGKPVGELYPRRDFFYDSQQPMTIPGVRSTFADDFYVLLVDWEEISSNSATFKIYHNPLVKWMWVGSWVFIIGTLISAWPEKEKETAPKRSQHRVAAAAD